MPKVTELARAFNVNPATVRYWGKEFAEYLSDHANPPKGETRYFNEDDCAVMALVARMRDRVPPGSYDEIRAALGAGDRGRWPPAGVTTGTAQEGPQSDNELVRQATAAIAKMEGRLAATEEALQREILARAKAEESRREAEKRAVKAETELEILRSLYQQEQAQGADLPPQERQEEPRRSWWDRLLGRAE